MLEKILKKVTNNLGFKVLALLFAFALWVIVYNINDPTKTRTYTAEVEVKNADFMTNLGKYAEVKDGTGSVSFSVTAKRTVLDKLNDDDFVAVADYSKALISKDEKSATVPVDIESKRSNGMLKYNAQGKYVTLSLEKLKAKQFVISANTTGKVANGYALGSVKVVNPTVLKIQGPNSVVKRVHSVVATIDVGNMNIDITDKVKPKLYDAQGNEVPTDKLKLSNVSISVSAKILKTKKVNINIPNKTIKNSDGKNVSLKASENSVLVMGSDEALEQINDINISSDVFNGNSIKGKTEVTIDLKKYLPEEVELVNEKESKLTVHLYLEGEEEQAVTLTVPTSSIKMNGLDSKYQASFVQSNVVMKVTADAANMSALNANDVEAVVDLSGLSAGTHSVKVTLNLDSSKYKYSGITTQVVIKNQNQTQSQPQTNTQEQTNTQDNIVTDSNTTNN
ncbi:YbbR domain-containing protein [Lachnospiraceae bacterium C7]|nr:YbbR domain-containing protein [Lachnospiraceae bacterium C7]